MIGKSQLIGRIGAQKIQNRARKCGDLVIWVIYDHPQDFPDLFVCRPFIGERPLLVHLCHKDLALLRHRLPNGVFPLNRFADDDPAILETWI